MASLKTAGIAFAECDGVEPNPKISSVRGGSTMDASKVIAAAFYYDGDPWDMIFHGQPDPHIPTRGLPIITHVTEAYFNGVDDTPILKEHLFADLFIRDVISHQERELATIAALANMTGTGGQLGFHLGGAMNTGLTEEQMEDFISVFETAVSKTRAESAKKILVGVLASRK